MNKVRKMDMIKLTELAVSFYEENEKDMDKVLVCRPSQDYEEYEIVFWWIEGDPNGKFSTLCRTLYGRTSTTLLKHFVGVYFRNEIEDDIYALSCTKEEAREIWDDLIAVGWKCES